MLERTGFVLPDVGIYTITAMVGKTDPTTVTPADLDVVADQLEAFYSTALGKYIAGSFAFTQNGGFTHPQWGKSEHKRVAFATLVLRGHQNADLTPVFDVLDDNGKTTYKDMVLRDLPDAPRCVFSGMPAYLRVSRDMLPLFNGRGVLNFSPRGESGVAVSAEILLALHAMPLGCLVTQGALLAVESDDADLMFTYARTHLKQNQQYIQLTHLEKMPNFSSFKTRLIDVLVDAGSAAATDPDSDFKRTASLTAYHFSNYGANPRIQLYQVGSNVVGFIGTVTHGRHSPTWNAIVRSAWHEEKTTAEELERSDPKITRRNFLYEDLFELPENARRFLSLYFLRKPTIKRQMAYIKNDPRTDYDLATESDLLSWDLTALFLQRIMLMEKKRIDRIREMGDSLAAHIRLEDKHRFLNRLYRARQYWQFRQALIHEFKSQPQDATAPLFTFDAFVDIFEEGTEFERLDWNLARDLLFIRIFEQLQASGHWAAVTEVLGAQEDEEDQPETEDVLD